MPKENELTITRVYDAPVKLVWDAWTDPKKAAKWWGPRGFTITTHSKDLRPGGIWHYTMHGPDGIDYPNKTKYYEVVPLKKLVYDHGGNDEQAPLFRVTVTFEETLGKTVMIMIMDFGSPEKARELKKFIKQAGGNSTWDRLGEYLGDAEGKNKFIINRSFETTPTIMFRMWTEAEHFCQWLPPTGFTMSYTKADIRPGGTLSYSMTNGEFTMHGRLTYREISPEKIVYAMEFLDEKGNITRHPALKVFPACLVSTITIAAEGEGFTRVTVETEAGGDYPKEELAALMELRTSMTQGWTGSFDKLEALLP